MTSPGDDGTGPIAWLRWFLRTDRTRVAFVREALGSVLAVILVGVILFAVSGVWPPMVAVESESMAPHMRTGDLVFVMEEGRFAGAGAYGDTGVVPYTGGTVSGYRKFDDYGDVIVYSPDSNDRATPIIHRARFWVNDSENWYGKAEDTYIGGAEDCGDLANCPSPHAGFITKGDANHRYDQVGAAPISGPVRPGWIVGTAEFRIPWLGWIRLQFARAAGGLATAGAVLGGRPGGS